MVLIFGCWILRYIYTRRRSWEDVREVLTEGRQHCQTRLHNDDIERGRFSLRSTVTALTSSTMTLMIISADRFLAVRFPLKVRDMQRNCRQVVIAIWIVSFAVSIPFIIFRRMVTLKVSRLMLLYIYEREDWDIRICVLYEYIHILRERICTMDYGHKDGRTSNVLLREDFDWQRIDLYSRFQIIILHLPFIQSHLLIQKI